MSNVLMLQSLGEDRNATTEQNCLSWASCHSTVSGKKVDPIEPTKPEL